ncbi:MAG: hypothetical protein CAK85_01040 [Spartobacteria bacterium AMD-G5]|nr:MAG: hypothetical protein CAK85_01040 [Spartobacteria bacterium AMD-G5]
MFDLNAVGNVFFGFTPGTFISHQRIIKNITLFKPACRQSVTKSMGHGPLEFREKVHALSLYLFWWVQDRKKISPTLQLFF